MNLSFIRTREVVSADIEQQKIRLEDTLKSTLPRLCFLLLGFLLLIGLETAVSEECVCMCVCVCVCVLGRVSWLIVRFFDVEVIGFQIFFLNKRMFSKVVQRDGK